MSVDIIVTETHFVLRGNTKPHRDWIKALYQGKWDPVTLEWSIPRSDQVTYDQLVDRIASFKAAKRQQRSERAKRAWRKREEMFTEHQTRERNFREYADAHPSALIQLLPHDKCYACDRYVFAKPIPFEQRLITSCACGISFVE